DVEYTGDSSPEVSTVFDRLGRPTTVTDETMGTRTFAYRDSGTYADLLPSSVTFTSNYYGTAIKSLHFIYKDAPGDNRLDSLQLKNSAGTEVYRSTYQYQPGTGLLQAVASDDTLAAADRT